MLFLQWHFTMSPNIWKSHRRMCEYESLQENILFCYDGFYFSLCWLANLLSFFFLDEEIWSSISWCCQNIRMFLCIDTYIITGMRNACTYTHSVDRELYFFFLNIWTIFHSCQQKYFPNLQPSNCRQWIKYFKRDCRWFI